MMPTGDDIRRMLQTEGFDAATIARLVQIYGASRSEYLIEIQRVVQQRSLQRSTAKTEPQ